MSSSFKIPKEKEPYFPVGVKVAVYNSSELGRIVHPPGATATLETMTLFKEVIQFVSLVVYAYLSGDEFFLAPGPGPSSNSISGSYSIFLSYLQ